MVADAESRAEAASAQVHIAIQSHSLFMNLFLYYDVTVYLMGEENGEETSDFIQWVDCVHPVIISLHASYFFELFHASRLEKNAFLVS